MSQRNTIVRSLHDLGAATWFGGTLMGAVGLNGGTAAARQPQERLRLSSVGWAKWAPVQWAGIVAHGVGGIGLILGNKSRIAGQPASRTNTVVKSAVTFAALGATVWSGLEGAVIAKHSDEGTQGVTEPGDDSSKALAAAQRKQKVLQFAIPVLTGVIIVMGAQQGEQQRPLAGLLGWRR